LFSGIIESPYRPAPARWAESSGRSAWRLQIDHKLELRRLLNGKIRGLGAFKDFVDVEGSATFADLDVPKRRAA